MTEKLEKKRMLCQHEVVNKWFCSQRAYGNLGNTENGTGTGQINECFKLGSIIDINTPALFYLLYNPRKMDDDTRRLSLG